MSMDNKRRVQVAKAKPEQERHQLLSASSSGRRRRCCGPTNSPEFEFWMVRNPSFPQPNLLSADQLFVDGVLLPLHLLQSDNNNNNSHHQSDPPAPQLDTRSSLPEPRPEMLSAASVTTAAEPITSLTSSKRWTDIFRRREKKAAAASNKNQEDNEDGEKKMLKEKEEMKDQQKKKNKRDKKGGLIHKGGSSSAELNIIINIWPFSRSRSAGNSGSRPRMFPGALGTRKSSSAPCSRSNSAGESKSRKWPSIAGRPGIHLGRSSPVWQARRCINCARSGGVSSGYNSVKSNNFYELVAQSGERWASKKEVTVPRRSKTGSSSNGSGSKKNNNNNSNNGGGGSTNSKAKVLNLKVPTMCIGYRNHLSCRRDGNGGLTGAAVGGSNRGVESGNIDNLGNGGNRNIFNFFTKKVY